MPERRKTVTIPHGRDPTLEQGRSVTVSSGSSTPELGKSVTISSGSNTIPERGKK
ncbi:hypothetical protein HGM15179_011585, partial [Zosterops borbonicus]